MWRYSQPSSPVQVWSIYHVPHRQIEGQAMGGADADDDEKLMDCGCSLHSASSPISSKSLKRSLTSFMSAPTTLPSFDRQLGSERQRSTAVREIDTKSKRASMPTIGVKTRSVSLRDARINEHWEELYNDNVNASANNTRDFNRNISSLYGLHRPPPEASTSTMDAGQIFLRELQRQGTQSSRVSTCNISSARHLKESIREVGSRDSMKQRGCGLSLLQVAAAAAAATRSQVTDSTNNSNNDKKSSDDLVPTITCISTTTGVSKLKDKLPTVTLAESKNVTYILEDFGDDDDTTRRWYSTSDNELFLNDAKAHAAIVNRMMMYSSKNEPTYNSATGLTAPHALKEYLASPEEIIGIEHPYYQSEECIVNKFSHYYQGRK